ncbi:hypothetical protein NLJ89_g11756 [Agrocybe chaxingu]|uniref:Uncharacterized protein n=1 Tax=Agrocybe chaxingu TaxID=84603 RepID=A0A9W8MPQ5_9AGAR|nr:hypothetical protein NLJ89_g11756 [Agrocybe chaxingu]
MIVQKNIELDNAKERLNDTLGADQKRAADLSEAVRKQSLSAFKASIELQGLPASKKRKLRQAELPPSFGIAMPTVHLTSSQLSYLLYAVNTSLGQELVDAVDKAILELPTILSAAVSGDSPSRPQTLVVEGPAIVSSSSVENLDSFDDDGSTLYSYSSYMPVSTVAPSLLHSEAAFDLLNSMDVLKSPAEKCKTSQEGKQLKKKKGAQASHHNWTEGSSAVAPSGNMEPYINLGL